MRISMLVLAMMTGAVAADPAFVQSQQGNLRIDTVATDLAHPWGISVLPDGRLLVTERDGRLRYIDKSGQLSAPITGLPAIVVAGQGARGLLHATFEVLVERIHEVSLASASASDVTPIRLQMRGRNHPSSGHRAGPSQATGMDGQRRTLPAVA